jgi:hypothetical protein
MRYFSAIISLLLVISCSHSYQSNTLDLGFYQWNMWPDTLAIPGADSLYGTGADLSLLPSHPPSCGWEVLHRGNGKLVRVPAVGETHFPEVQYSPVYWFHCRFSLPDLWDRQKIVLQLEGVSHRAEVYLNENLVGFHLGGGTPFRIDLTDRVYYTRDNHMAIRICDPREGKGGITGKVVLVAGEPPVQ